MIGQVQVLGGMFVSIGVKRMFGIYCCTDLFVGFDECQGKLDQTDDGTPRPCQSAGTLF